jgi:hypothetical protein
MEHFKEFRSSIREAIQEKSLNMIHDIKTNIASSIFIDEAIKFKVGMDIKKMKDEDLMGYMAYLEDIADKGDEKAKKAIKDVEKEMKSRGA